MEQCELFFFVCCFILINIVIFKIFLGGGRKSQGRVWRDWEMNGVCVHYMTFSKNH